MASASPKHWTELMCVLSEGVKVSSSCVVLHSATIFGCCRFSLPINVARHRVFLAQLSVPAPGPRSVVPLDRSKGIAVRDPIGLFGAGELPNPISTRDGAPHFASWTMHMYLSIYGIGEPPRACTLDHVVSVTLNPNKLMERPGAMR
jgi:hypothetical protein